MKLKRFWFTGLILICLLGLAAGCAQKQQSAAPANKNLILSSTTDVQDTGLMDALIPVFQTQTGYVVKPIYNGSGQAIKLGETGEADVLITHAPSAEQPGVSNGTFINYQLLMHNFYVFVGPPGDPAKIKGLSATAALQKIAAARAVFVSRGDNSGTNIAGNSPLEKGRHHTQRQLVSEVRPGNVADPVDCLAEVWLYDERPQHLPDPAEECESKHPGAGRQCVDQYLPRDGGQSGQILQGKRRWSRGFCELHGQPGCPAGDRQFWGRQVWTAAVLR